MESNSGQIVIKKILLVGDSQVGKSNLLIRVADDTFQDGYISTIGVDFKIITTDDGRFKLQIWDTAGQERFRTITKSYYRGAQIIVLVFSVNNRHSFENLEKHLKEVLDQCDSTIEKLLIGTKNDCSGREVSIDEAEKWALDHEMAYLDFSAKNDCQATLRSKFVEVVEKHHSLTN